MSSLWRLGYIDAPCEFAPLHLYAWDHRFDDSERQYRTIYGADRKETCFREVLADLRPDATAVREFERVFGKDAELTRVVGLVTKAWLDKNVLVRALVILASGELVRIETPAQMRDLSERLSVKLDVGMVRGRDRNLTRRISRLLFDSGRAGIQFVSRLDGSPCTALFEGRAFLRQEGETIRLSADVAELARVCREYGLRLAAT